MEAKKAGFCITTDTMSDLPEAYLREHGIELLSLTYTIDGQTYNKDNTLTFKEFYDRMRKGSQPTTSQFNPEDAEAVFSRMIEETNQDILHLSISSALSGSCQSAQAAAISLKEKYPDRRILVFDTLGASLGQGLMCAQAVDMRAQGLDVQDAFEKLTLLRPHVAHVLTVEDIIYLYRGGRVSRTTAIVGGMLDIKPLIHVDDEGRLIPFGKVRGRRRSLLALVDSMEKQLRNYRDRNKVIYISHADAEDDAKFLAEQIKQRLGFAEFVITPLGTTIGAHTGPGLIALFFLGDHR